MTRQKAKEEIGHSDALTFENRKELYEDKRKQNLVKIQDNMDKELKFKPFLQNAHLKEK